MLQHLLNCLRVPQNCFSVFRMILSSIIDNQSECASGFNQILMNIVLKSVLWIHCHKGLRHVTANNFVACKFKLHLVSVIIIHYSSDDIFCWLIDLERHALRWTMEKCFLAFILKDILDQTYPCLIEFSINVFWIIWQFSC